jgi:exodeoxyribonuclease VII small subunit
MANWTRLFARSGHAQVEASRRDERKSSRERRTWAVDSAVTASEQEHLSYEEARDELIEIVRRLESGGAPLEESLALWERGERLAEICQQWLDGARDRVAAARTGGPPAQDGAPPDLDNRGTASPA